MRIYLVGYMGSGKSTLGREMSKKLGFRYVDLDEMMEKEARKPVDRVFTEKGEERFRIIEARLLRETKRLFNVIVGTGGGAASFEDNMYWMNQNGITVYLKVSSGELYHRLVVNKTERPLLRDVDDIKLMEQIQSHIAFREPYYETAKHLIKGDSITSTRVLKVLNIGESAVVKR